MRSPEAHTYTTQEIKEKKSGFASFWDFTVFKNVLPKIASPREPVSWQSGNYLNELRLMPRERASSFLPEIRRRIKQDSFSYLKEFGAFQNVISYDTYTEFGIDGGYSSTDTVQRCINFARYQELLGRPAERAWLDVDLQKEVRSWQQDKSLPPGSYLIFFSPRGEVDESYPGLEAKYYNCIYVACRKEDGTSSFKQIHSWDSSDQLMMLQQQWGNKGTLHEVPIKHKKPTTEHVILSRYVTLPPEVTTFQNLFNEAYQHKPSWEIDPDKISPKIAEDIINSNLILLADALASEFEKTIAASLILSDTLPDYLNQELDGLLEIFRDAVKRWAHDSASNIGEKNKKLTDLSSPEAIAQMVETWKSKMKINRGSATQEDKQRVNKFQALIQLPANSPIHQAASLAHCIAGTPLSLSTQLAQLQNVELFSALKSGKISMAQIEQLVGKERAAHWHPGKCVMCGTETIVGECDWCYLCETDPSKTLGIPFEDSKQKFIDSLSGEDKNKGKKMLDQLSELTLRKTVSFEQLINNDFVNPAATEDDELKPYLDRILFAPNGLEELEKIVRELSTNNKEKEHNNSGKIFAMPLATQSSKKSLAA